MVIVLVCNSVHPSTKNVSGKGGDKYSSIESYRIILE